ncbi:MAG: hypothetical protein WEB55_02905 [Acidimicrobiia bacterium]
MFRSGGAFRFVMCCVVATAMFAPIAPAHADLLGGLTDTVDDTVESGGDLIDDTAASTDTALDEPVEDAVGFVEETSDDLTDVVDATAETIIDEDEASTTDPSTEDVSTTTTTTTTTTTPSAVGTSTTTTSVPEQNTDEPDRMLDEDHTLPVVDRGTGGVSGGGGESVGSRSADPDALTVLSAVGGLTDPVHLEPISLDPITDTSLYGRLLGWLAAAGTGVQALLAGPLLALEILIRALVSAGSGLVAPISMLAAYLGHMTWETRNSRRGHSVT